MADQRMYNYDEHLAWQQPRNRGFDFETELNKYCSQSDIKKYKLCKDARGSPLEIGRGAFGSVYEAIDSKLGRPVALKVMKKEHILSNRFERRVVDEIRIHSTLMHPRIVEIYECFHDQKRIYIALELCPGGDLEHRLRTGVLPEDMAASIFRQVAEGVVYLHRVKTSRDGSVVGSPILHRDLKPSNICFASDNSVKICDFNLATEVLSDSQRNTTYCGTPGYMPPEVAQKIPYSFEVDAYGLGCILYSMLFGGPPGKRNDPHSSKVDVYIPDGVVSVEAETLLKNLLCKDGRRRMPVKAIARDQFLMKYAQRKRLASIDSGFDTQHTGSSFPEPQPRRAASRERPALRPAPDQQCRALFRRPPPAAPLRPPSADYASAGLFPPSSFGHSIPPRPPSMHRSPVPPRKNIRQEDCASAFNEPNMPVSVTRDPGFARSPPSPPAVKTKEPSGRSSKTKVRITNNVMQAVYLDNGDFMAKFPCGKIAMKKGSMADIIATKNKQKTELTRLEEAHFQKELRIVGALEKVCAEECGVNAICDCFPVLIDGRSATHRNS